MKSITNFATREAIRIACDKTCGYDQVNRWGPDYDCSSLIITAWKNAGIPLSCTYTGNMYSDMLSKGFLDVTEQVDLATGEGLEIGDVLLNVAHHTAIVGPYKDLIEATGNEFGGVKGGQTGDQANEIGINRYYNFPWDYVLRYDETDDDTVEAENGDYIVKNGDNLWSIAEKQLGNPLLWEKIQQLNELTTLTIYPGQLLKLPDLGTKVCSCCGRPW